MFETGTVVAAYPEGLSVDVLLDDGRRLSNVQVLTPTGSSHTGMIDLPDVGGPIDDKRWDPTAVRDRYVKAMVGFCRGVPFVAGFLLPQINQITFAEKNRRIVRHASDVYTSIDDAGNIELYHPSGTYLRIGEAAAHEDLTGDDFDARWAITRNTNKAVYVKLRVSNAGDDKASIEITPAGNVTLQCDGNLAATVGGNASANVTGTTSVVSGGAASLQAPSVTVTSPESTFTGHVTIQGGLAVSGGSGAAVTGNIAVTSGNVTADGIGLKTHVHGGVDPGAGNTGGPSG
jgi:hypothetical protein